MSYFLQTLYGMADLIIIGRFNGVGIGTVIMTCINGLLIGMFGKLIDRCFIFVPLFPKLEEKMRL